MPDRTRPIDAGAVPIRSARSLASVRGLGLALVAVGLAAAFVVQAHDRGHGPPLYDGVILVEPYLWVDPPSDQQGGPEGASATIAVHGGQSDFVAVATDEAPPQAQIVAEPGSFTLARTATSLSVSIKPIAVAEPVPGGYVDGNAYQFTLVDQDGRPATAPASALVSIIMRAADPTLTDAQIERLDGTTWVPLETSSAGNSEFLAVATRFGVFAVVAKGVSPYPSPTPGITQAASASPALTPETGPATTLVPATPAPGSQAVPGDATSMQLALLAAAIGVTALLAIAWLWRRRRPPPTRREGWTRRR